MKIYRHHEIVLFIENFKICFFLKDSYLVSSYLLKENIFFIEIKSLILRDLF